MDAHETEFERPLPRGELADGTNADAASGWGAGAVEKVAEGGPDVDAESGSAGICGAG